jgi:diketogulonate reductase-like aldo/keto reductase
MAAQDEGIVRTIGISNVYDVGVLKELAKERKVQIVQNRWYEGNAWDTDVWAYCKENGIVYQYVSFRLCSCPLMVNQIGRFGH